jgi:hypothetical protein
MKSVHLKEFHSKYYKFQFKSLKSLVLMHNLCLKFTIPNYNFHDCDTWELQSHIKS